MNKDPASWRRRQSTQALLCAALAPAWRMAEAASAPPWRMPDEGSPHRRTWMAWGAQAAIWGRRQLPDVREDLARIAGAIVRFEPVSMWVRAGEEAQARALLCPQVDLVVGALDDVWMRDTGPVFVQSPEGQRAAVGFNFNGWGGKQAHAHDRSVAQRTAAQAGVAFRRSALTLEGGGIEVDGEGTAIITESCVLNDNRNPGLSKADVEAHLRRDLGLTSVIWLPGVRGRDVTDGHTDFYARFVRPGVVVAALDPDPQSFDHAVTQTHLRLLRQAKDAQGRALEVITLPAPQRLRAHWADEDFAAGYINFYVCNGAVIAPQFGDPKADAFAHGVLQRLYAPRVVVPVAIDAIAAGGGGIHCVTQQEPA